MPERRKDVGDPRRHPDFEPGNVVAVSHGAYSDRVLEPVARRFVDELSTVAPAWLAGADQAAVTAWARAEARLEALETWVAEHGLLDSEGNPTSAASFLLRAERAAAELRARLGLDPLSRSKISRDSAIAHAAAESAVERATAAGRAIREQREQQS